MTGSYNVQDCNVSSDQHTSSILVECTFAINSTAPGIVVIQDAADQSQYTINKTLQRLLQDSDKGSVNITGLPAGEYSVRVYDNSPATDGTSAAYQYSQLVYIMGLIQPSSIVLHSAFASGEMHLCLIFIVRTNFIDTESLLMSRTTVHKSVTPALPTAASMHFIISCDLFNVAYMRVYVQVILPL